MKTSVLYFFSILLLCFFGCTNVRPAITGNMQTEDLESIGEDFVTTMTLNNKDRQPYYRIGDTGPAGGIIFYDKGNYSDGWRYLEAAPAATDKIDQKVFSLIALYSEISNRSVGAGLNNTRMYLERLQKNNITNTSFHYADNLIYNNFNDWFLPSIEELHLMYKNLRNNSNAGFLPKLYWSSTCYPIGSDYPGAGIFLNFSNGRETLGDWSGTIRIRACRRF